MVPEVESTEHKDLQSDGVEIIKSKGVKRCTRNKPKVEQLVMSQFID